MHAEFILRWIQHVMNKCLPNFLHLFTLGSIQTFKTQPNTNILIMVLLTFTIPLLLASIKAFCIDHNKNKLAVPGTTSTCRVIIPGRTTIFVNFMQFNLLKKWNKNSCNTLQANHATYYSCTTIKRKLRKKISIYKPISARTSTSKSKQTILQ